MTSNIYFKSNLSFDNVVSMVENLFNKKSYTRDDFSEKVFRIFSFYSILIDTYEINKKGNFYTICSTYVPTDWNIDLKNQEEAFSNYFLSIITTYNIGTPVNANMEDFNLEKLSTLSGSIKFESTKKTEAIKEILEQVLNGKFIQQNDSYLLKILGLTVELKEVGKINDKLQYTLTIIDSIVNTNDSIQLDISPYLADVILDNKYKIS